MKVYKVRSLAINSSGDIFAVTCDGEDIPYYGCFGGVFRLTDNGAKSRLVGRNDMLTQCVAINSIGHIFVGYVVDLLCSTDNGESMKQICGFGDLCLRSIAINSSGHIFAGTKFGGIYRSTDNGAHWSKINTGLTDFNIISLVINSSKHIFAGTWSGVYRSTDNGDNWTQINTGLTDTHVWCLAINSNDQIFAGTDGGGVFRSVKSTTDVK
jgi:photosystem II stability/assembly factor-like uncharacterized protein